MQNSKIEWTDHTFNPWWGCQRVSPGCEHCYAETMAHRYGYNVWGPAKTTGRRMMSENYWKQPYKWNKAAAAAGERQRVFCASMADVFEDHPDVAQPRRRLFSVIEATPHLDWLLLTKRPENIRAMVPPAWLDAPQPNVWLGTSVEDQQRADERIPELLSVPARVRFLSCEPLLGPVDLDGWLWEDDGPRYQESATTGGIHWVIVGGESGPHARPMRPAWARSLRGAARAAGVPFHFKQHGEWVPYSWIGAMQDRGWQGDWTRCQTIVVDGLQYVRVGKHAAGRQLDGREWNEVPA